MEGIKEDEKVELVVREVLQEHETRSFLPTEELWRQTLERMQPVDGSVADYIKATSTNKITLNQVPTLFRRALLESRITAKILAALASRPVVTVYDLEMEVSLAENVPSFSELHLGRLAEWPLVQRYFQCGATVLDIKGADFVSFLTMHPDAAPLRNGVGDARDAVSAFRIYTERNDGKRPLHSRWLGIHIQHFEELITAVRAEAHRREQSLVKLVMKQSLRCEANRKIYQKMVEAVDAAAATGGEARFSIDLSTEEVAESALPHSWRQDFCASSQASPRGGMAMTWEASGLRKGGMTSTSAADQTPLPAAPPVVNAARVRRMRQRVIIDEEPTFTAPTPPSTAHLETLPADLWQQGSPSRHVISSQPLEGKPTEEDAASEDAKIHIQHLQDALLRPLKSEAQLDLLMDDLISIPNGIRLPFVLVYQFALHLSQAEVTPAVWQRFYFTPFIPLLSSPDDESGILKEWAAPSSLYWTFPTVRDLPCIDVMKDRDAKAFHSILERCASRIYPADLELFFTSTLGVMRYPSVMGWIAAWSQPNARHQLLNDGGVFERQYLETFAFCVDEEYRHRMAARGASSVEDDAAVLDEMTGDIPGEIAFAAYMFPHRNQWCRGIDLYACGPRYKGCAELYLKPLETHNESYQLQAISFDHPVTHVMCKVLQCCGVALIESVAEVFVAVEQPDVKAEREMEGDLLSAVKVIIPVVQLYLQKEAPLLFALSSEMVQARLRSLRVVLGYRLRVTEQVSDLTSGVPFVMSDSPRLRYVASHNTLYGEREQFSSPVLAEELCAVLLPLQPPPDVMRELKKVVHSLLGRIREANGKLQVQADAIVEEELKRLRASGVKTEGCGEVVWDLPVPSTRVQRIFPPGTDAWEGAAGTGRRGNRQSCPALGRRPTQWVTTTLLPYSHPQAFIRQCLEERGGCSPSVASVAPSRKRRRAPSGRETISEGQAVASAQAAVSGEMRQYSVAAEKFAFEQLKEKYKDDNTVEVVWVNESGERGEPFDLVVLRKTSSQSKEPLILCFIEVKSTCTSDRHDFEMSLAELIFAARYGSAYHVHRVYSASTSALKKMRLVSYANLVNKWIQGQLTLTGNVRVVPCNAGASDVVDG